MNTMKNTILLVCLLSCSWEAYSQQLPLTSEYMFNRITVNPAYVGNKTVLSSSLSYRTMLTGFEGAPVTQYLTVDAPIQSKYMALGLKLMNDKIGVSTQVGISGIYGYYIGLGPGRLTIAIEGGVTNLREDFSSLVKADPNDNTLQISTESKLFPDAGFGLYYNTDNYYGGISVLNLIQSRLNFSDVTTEGIAQLNRHYYLMGGYLFELNDLFDIEPSFVGKYVKGSKVQADINTNLIFKDLVSTGLAYRSNHTIVFAFRFMFQSKFRVGYAFDLPVSSLSSYYGKSHEISLGYDIKLKEPPKKKVTDPRYYH